MFEKGGFFMKKLLKSILTLIIAVCALQLFAVTVQKEFNADNVKPVKYVFLFIGDGMSLPQRMTAQEFSHKTGKGNLFINSMPFSGSNFHQCGKFIYHRLCRQRYSHCLRREN